MKREIETEIFVLPNIRVYFNDKHLVLVLSCFNQKGKLASTAYAFGIIVLSIPFQFTNPSTNPRTKHNVN